MDGYAGAGAEALDDDALLAAVWAERRRSVGFDHDDELAASRERALNYYKGRMPDVPSMPGRSKAVSTDVAEAVETLLPDLVEIFAGSEEVASFQPVGAEDEAAAQQETDYVNHVVFHENAGFLVLYTLFKDALLQKTGVVKFWWEAGGAAQDERFAGKSAMELQVAAQAGGQIRNFTERVDEDGAPAFDFTLRTPGRGGVRVAAVPPEDFTIAADATDIAGATYCAMRSRPRAQDLIGDGYDRALIEALPAYADAGADQAAAQARDTAGEHEGWTGAEGHGDLRTVEVVEHYLRIDAQGQGAPQLWKVVTGAGETVLLDRRRVEQAPFAAVTPYLTPHRFYGRSVADLLAEIQRIKTALTRMALDSGYFALNQRQEVALERANQFTIGDLLRNEPGVPVRSKTGDAVRPIAAGGLGFDAFGALEYFSTVAEQRTGIARNAQGLAPDTLHDTARGALALMNAAHKRVRLIARIFAETGIKDLFLGVHALVRRNATAAAKVRLRGRWVEVDPTAWGERKDMTIEVGVGAGGREHDLMVARELWGMQREIVQMQGGVAGPFVTAGNVHNLLKRIGERAGLKAVDAYFSDPATLAPAAPAPPRPDPALVAAQLKAQAETALKRERMQAEIGLKREQLSAELQLKREQIEAEARLRAMEAAAQVERGEALSGVHVGGEVAG